MDGILAIRKPAGMTSFDVIARLRKQYGQKKFGHAGTLDPMASGVLVVLAGTACKILPYLSDTDKEYIASLELGTSYDTDDITGTPEKSAPVHTDFDFQQTLDTFLGKSTQIVPKASAKKVNGKKLYDYLRAGQDVPEVTTEIEVYEIEALPTDDDPYRFRTRCSSGTYIRSICRDLGRRTGNLAAMSKLERTRANGFTLEEAQPLDAPAHTLYSIERLLDYPKVQAREPADIRNGKKIRLDHEADRVLMMDGDQVLAIYSRVEDGKNLFACTRGLWQ